MALYERPLDLAAFDELIIIGCARILQKNSVWPHSPFWPESQARANCMAEPKTIAQTVVLYRKCTLLWMRFVYSLLNYACESQNIEFWSKVWKEINNLGNIEVNHQINITSNTPILWAFDLLSISLTIHDWLCSRLSFFGQKSLRNASETRWN